MAFQLSPGVLVTEKDLTNVVPAVSSSAAAFCGDFAWGPVNTVQLVTSENELVKKFGKPGFRNTVDWFSAANFLGYGNNLQVVRAVPEDAENATSDGNGIFIPNEESYLAVNASGDNGEGVFAAKHPGAFGNGLTIEMADNNTFTGWDYAGEFSKAPGTSGYADTADAVDDELHIVVVDTRGVFSGVKGTILEKFAFVSKASDAKNSDGSSNYYKNVLNAQSKYVWWLDHPADGDNWGSVASGVVDGQFDNLNSRVVNTLGGGSDGTEAPVAGDITAGYALFKNKELYDVSLIITGGHGSVVQQYCIDDIALDRLDCVVFLSPDLASVLNNSNDAAADVVAYRTTTVNRDTSYAVMDSGWKVQYDRYNDAYVNIPLNPDTAGLCARTDRTNDAWWSPAGLNRGQIKNIVKLLWSPNQAERDELYKNAVNPVVTFPGQGTVLYGDKTLRSKPSAFDRINVRRLFIVLEKAIATAAKYQLFEFNDVFTRSQFRSLVEPFLRDVRGRRGIYDFRVVCDETNNTGEVIDRNEFVADIYIKPAKSINFIYLNFIATRTSVSFEEVGA